MSFEEFQNGLYGGQLGYKNRTSLAIRNFVDAPVPPRKYLLNPTSHPGADIQLTLVISTSLISNNRLSQSENLVPA